MADAYLRWKYGSNTKLMPAQPPQPSPTTGVTDTGSLLIPPAAAPSIPTSTDDISTGDPSLPQLPNNPNGSTRDSPPPSIDLELAAINIYTLSKSVKIRVPSEGTDTTASALAALGFIGNAPFKPSVAVSIRTLELYRICQGCSLRLTGTRGLVGEGRIEGVFEAFGS